MASFQSKGLMKGSGKSLSSDGKAILGVFIGAMIAVVFLASFADNIFEQTNVLLAANETSTLGAPNTSVDIKGREVVSVIEIFNESTDALTGSMRTSGNVTITTGMSATTGLLSVQLNAESNSSEITGQVLNYSYTYLDDGYVSTSGGRAITTSILLFAALAIVVFIIVMFIKKGSLGTLIGRR